MFDIDLPPEVHSDEGARFYEGRFVLGEHSERFLAAAKWDVSRYKTQWRAAAQELLNGAGRAAFVTSFVHPDANQNFIWAHGVSER